MVSFGYWTVIALTVEFQTEDWKTSPADKGCNPEAARLA
jgi:hypothetical protein